jgi:hypothetical protein
MVAFEDTVTFQTASEQKRKKAVSVTTPLCTVVAYYGGRDKAGCSGRPSHDPERPYHDNRHRERALWKFLQSIYEGAGLALSRLLTWYLVS